MRSAFPGDPAEIKLKLDVESARVVIVLTVVDAKSRQYPPLRAK
jgi:hypothetical protein